MAQDFQWQIAKQSTGFDPNTIYFTAGLQDEQHGLFGFLTSNSPAGSTVAANSGAAAPNSRSSRLNAMRQVQRAFLESVQILQEGLQSFLSIRRIDAR